jgi:hypothetical protein
MSGNRGEMVGSEALKRNIRVETDKDRISHHPAMNGIGKIERIHRL